jgi:hypothetical protein
MISRSGGGIARFKSFVCMFVVGQLLACSQLAFAHGAAVHTTKAGTSFSASSATSAHAVNLDLSSVTQTLSASLLALSNSLNILVGNNLQTVNQTSQLTPAEFLAAYQVLSTGNQGLRLGAQGNAIGGRFSIPTSFSNDIANLVVPQGVKLLDNVALSPSLNLSGNLIDAGKILVFTTSTQATNAYFGTANIIVEQGGVFSSVATHQQSASTVSLTLNALNNILNYGTIASSGDLSLNAGGSITNTGQATAAGDVNLYSYSGAMTNSGIVNAQAGNIHISSLATNNINLNNTGGTFLAPNGAINIRGANYSGSANINLTGGDFLSQSLNLNDGGGSVNMNVGQVTGVVNTYAGSAHLVANTQDLQLGVFDVSGDPFISNNAGNLDIGFPISVSGAMPYLVATASGSIYSSAQVTIDTSATGGNVVLAAGVTETDTDGAVSLTRSGTGGDIYLIVGQIFDNHASLNIAGFTTGGGNVTLIAMNDGTNATNGGHIFLPANVVINTTGSTSAGSVAILAEAGFGTNPTVSLGGINAGGAGGNVIVKSATANLANATIDDSTGNITGSFDSNVIQTGSLSPGSITAGGSLTMNTFGGITLPASTLDADSSLTATSIVVTGNVKDTGSLAIHTNSLTFGLFPSLPPVSADIQASTLSLDDNFTDSVGGLTINDRSSAELASTTGTLTITANATSNATLTFASGSTNPNAVTALESPVAVNLSANNKIVVNTTLAANTGYVQLVDKSLSPWTVSAPIIQVAAGVGIAAAGNYALGGGDPLLPGTDLTIHTSVLNFGTNNTSSTGIAGNNVTVDNNCPNCNPANGLTINISGGLLTYAAYIVAYNGALNIGVEQPGTAITIQTQGTTPDIYTLVLGATTSVSISTSGQMTFGHSLEILSEFSYSGGKPTRPVGNWTITASTITLDDGASINAQEPEGVSPTLAIHTNSLNLGDGSNDKAVSITASALTIDNNLAGSTGVLQITTIDGTSDSLISTTTTTSISGTATNPGNLVISSLGGNGSILNLNSAKSVNLSGAAITIGQGMTLVSTATLNITGSGDIQLATTISDDGSVNVTNQNASSGDITVLPLSQVIAANGNIVLNNENTSDGTITLGANVFASAASITSGQGYVHIIMGATTAVAGTTPANVIKDIIAGGQILFGKNSIQANSPNNTIVANAGQVEFNTASLPDTAITLGGGDVIGAGKAPLLQGLDLTNPITAQLIKSEQAEKLLAGSLSPYNGSPTGSLTITPQNIVGSLNSENIPEGITVTMSGFSNTNPLIIQLNSQSTTNQVVINGTESFSSTATQDISSSVSSTVLSLNSGGSILGSTSLTINATGNIQLNGAANSKGALKIVTEPDANNNSGITIGGAIGNASSTTAATLIANGNGNISVGGAIGNKASATTISVNGTGNIVTAANDIVTGATVTLTSDMGNIGLDNNPLATAAAKLSISTTLNGFGYAAIDNTGAVTANATTGGFLGIFSTGNITSTNLDSTDGPLAVITDASFLLNPKGSLIASAGSLEVESLAPKSGKITIGTKSVITSVGNTNIPAGITLMVGLNIPSNDYSNGPIPNVIEHLSNNAQVTYTKGLAVLGPVNTINSNGPTIEMGILPNISGQIIIGGSVTMNANNISTPIAFNQQLQSTEAIVDTGDCYDSWQSNSMDEMSVEY